MNSMNLFQIYLFSKIKYYTINDVNFLVNISNHPKQYQFLNSYTLLFQIGKRFFVFGHFFCPFYKTIK
jgi:hypothetical protein